MELHAADEQQRAITIERAASALLDSTDHLDREVRVMAVIREMRPEILHAGLLHMARNTRFNMRQARLFRILGEQCVELPGWLRQQLWMEILKKSFGRQLFSREHSSGVPRRADHLRTGALQRGTR